MHYSTKTYGHDVGLSCVFRQPNAKSHCRHLHGYALSFTFKFGCNYLDKNNWVVDFGGLKDLKQWLQDHFDHKLILDTNDACLGGMKSLEAMDLCSVVTFDGVGCEKFAEHAWRYANNLVWHMTKGRCRCISCEVKEHGANSGIFHESEDTNMARV